MTVFLIIVLIDQLIRAEIHKNYKLNYFQCLLGKQVKIFD